MKQLSREGRYQYQDGNKAKERKNNNKNTIKPSLLCNNHNDKSGH